MSWMPTIAIALASTPRTSRVCPLSVPVQVRVRCALDAPPVSEDDPHVRRVLDAGPAKRIGRLEPEQVQALADIIAQRCGAMPGPLNNGGQAGGGAPPNRDAPS